MALWSVNTGDPYRITSITLFADDNAGFTSPTNLGTFTTFRTDNDDVFAIKADAFTFAPTQASHVRMQINSNNGGFDTRFSEAAFGVVPEPSAALLAGLGSLILLRRRRGA